MCVQVRVKEGAEVNKGDPVAILSAMKMEMGQSLSLSIFTASYANESSRLCSKVRKGGQSGGEGGRFARQRRSHPQARQVRLVMGNFRGNLVLGMTYSNRLKSFSLSFRATTCLFMLILAMSWPLMFICMLHVERQGSSTFQCSPSTTTDNCHQRHLSAPHRMTCTH